MQEKVYPKLMNLINGFDTNQKGTPVGGVSPIAAAPAVLDDSISILSARISVL